MIQKEHHNTNRQHQPVVLEFLIVTHKECQVKGTPVQFCAGAEPVLPGSRGN